MGHIVPHSPGGPRSEAGRSVEIDGFDNLILLCPSCHRTVDKEPDLWPEADLRDVKAEHEGWVAVLRARPEPAKTFPDEPLGLSESVEAGGVAFRIVGDPEEERSADGGSATSRAFALTPDGGHAWIRRVAVREPGPEAERRRSSLVAEAGLLAEALPGLPPLLAVEAAPGAVVVVTAVPSHATMDGFYRRRGRAAEVIRVLGAGLGGLCAGLASLHSRGLAHGDLDPDTIVADRGGALFLRDTGRAVRLGAEPAGPAEDVRRLAELVHLTVTGRPPVPLVSAAVLNPAVPEEFARTLGRALSLDPAERGDIADLAAGLRP